MPARHTSLPRRGTASSPSRLLVSVQQTLDDDAITPLALQLAVALVDADDPESATFVQGETRGVLGEDPGHDLPESPLGVSEAECIQRDTSGSLAARRRSHIHRMLGNARIRRPRSIGAGACPGDDSTFMLRDDRREAISFLDELRGDLFRSPRLGLEGGNPFRDPLV